MDGVDCRIEEAEISDEERSRMNDQVFQQMEDEVGIVMEQVFTLEAAAYGSLRRSLRLRRR